MKPLLLALTLTTLALAQSVALPAEIRARYWRAKYEQAIAVSTDRRAEAQAQLVKVMAEIQKVCGEWRIASDAAGEPECRKI